MGIGDVIYIIETNNEIREAEIIAIDDDFATVRYGYRGAHYIQGGLHYLQNKGGYRLRLSRIFPSEEEAEAFIERKKKEAEERKVIRILDKFN